MLSESIRRTYLSDGDEPVAVFVMEAWFYDLAKTDELGEGPKFCKCQQVIAALVTNDGDNVVKFFPGETGHESYYFESLADHLETINDHTDKPSMFGGFELAKFHLCSGTPGRYLRMETVVSDMKSMAAHFKNVLRERTQEVSGV